MKIQKHRIPNANEVHFNPNSNHVLSTKDFCSNDLIELYYRIFPKDDGIPYPVEYSKISYMNQDTFNVFLSAYGLYTLPTKELVDWLRIQIEDDPELIPDAIEICAGSGWIGRSLEIPMVDLKLQQSVYKDVYDYHGQPRIEYPRDIIKMDAIEAIKKWKPEFVIGSYVTSKYGLSGKDYGHPMGVDNLWVSNNCHKYFMIGNLNTHSKDRVMKRKHEELSFPWLITRGDSSKARIFVFENKQWI